MEKQVAPTSSCIVVLCLFFIRLLLQFLKNDNKCSAFDCVFCITALCADLASFSLKKQNKLNQNTILYTHLSTENKQQLPENVFVKANWLQKQFESQHRKPHRKLKWENVPKCDQSPQKKKKNPFTAKLFSTLQIQ